MSWILKFLRRLWTRQKPDGKSGWGALRYLLLGVILIAGGYWSLTKMDSSGSKNRASSLTGDLGKKKVDPVAQDFRTTEVASAAQETRAVDIKSEKKDSLAGSKVGMAISGDKTKSKAGQTASYFGDAPPTPTIQDRASSSSGADAGEDSIFTALSRSDQPTTADGRPVIDDSTAESKKSGRGIGAFTDPTVNGNSGRATNTQLPPIESLIARNLRPVASPTTTATPVVNPQDKTMKATHWLPRGEIIPVYLMQTVETGRIDTLIEFAVAKTIWFNGKPVLPFGTRFTATVQGKGVRDRIPFNVDSLRRRDGLEIAVSGMLLGPDKFSGVPAYYIPPPTMAQLAPYVGSFTTAFADILKQTITQSSSVSVGSGAISVTNQPSSLSSQVKEAGVYAASKALSDFMATQVNEIKERYEAYLTVPAGTFAFVQLKTNTDLSALWDGKDIGEARTIGTVKAMPTEQSYLRQSPSVIENNSSPTGTTEAPIPETTPARLSPTAQSSSPAAGAAVADPLAQ